MSKHSFATVCWLILVVMKLFFQIVFYFFIIHEIHSQSASTLFIKGKEEFLIGNYKNTIKLCMKAIQKNASLKEVNFYLGLSYYNLNDTVNAIQAFKQESKNNISDYRSFMYLCKLNIRNYMTAENYILESIRIQPTNFLLYFEKGNLNFFYKRYEIAIKDYNHAIELRSNLDDAYYKLGFCWLNLKDTLSACSNWRKINELDDFPEYLMIDSLCKKNY